MYFDFPPVWSNYVGFVKWKKTRITIEVYRCFRGVFHCELAMKRETRCDPGLCRFPRFCRNLTTLPVKFVRTLLITRTEQSDYVVSSPDRQFCTPIPDCGPQSRETAIRKRLASGSVDSSSGDFHFPFVRFCSVVHTHILARALKDVLFKKFATDWSKVIIAYTRKQYDRDLCKG